MSLHVDNTLFVGDQEFYQQVITSIQNDFKIGSEDIYDVLFAGQRFCLKMEGSNFLTQVDQESWIA